MVAPSGLYDASSRVALCLPYIVLIHVSLVGNVEHYVQSEGLNQAASFTSRKNDFPCTVYA